MYITKINLQNFRNYEKQEIEIKDGINLFYGDNAQGKTNILESIFLCAMGKSFRAKKEKELIRIGEENAKVEIEYKKNNREYKIEYQISDSKQILLNGIKINRLSELLGNIHIVLFSPDDIEILKDGPGKRRRFLNMMISQLRPNYVHFFNLYAKTLEQRNNYLRQIKMENKPEELLEIWDEKLAEYAKEVFFYRSEFIEKIMKKIVEIHNKITDGKEKIQIFYQSDFENQKQFKEVLEKTRKQDINRGYTTKGIHRDDFSIKINEKELDLYGSQGQFRTALLSLKLSELYTIYDEIGEYPILLLDDFMSELDEKRRKKLLENITDAQVLITGTHKIILENFNFNIYNVKEGKIIK